MSNYKVNIRYAKALFDIALEEKLVETVYLDMILLSEVCTESKELMHILKNPVIPIEKKNAIMIELFQSRITKLSLECILFIVRKHRGVNLKGISEAFMDLYKAYKNIKTVHLITATTANEEHKAQVKTLTGNFLKSTIDLQEQIDPKILGGFCIRFEDYLYDASISNKVTKLKKKFEKNEYAK